MFEFKIYSTTITKNYIPSGHDKESNLYGENQIFGQKWGYDSANGFLKIYVKHNNV